MLEKAPADTEVVAGLADVLVWQGKLEQALAMLDGARAIAPGDTSILNRRARVLARLGRTQESKAEYRTALRADPNDREAHAGLTGGGAGHDEGVIPRRELALEYGRGFRIADKGLLLRGVELSFSPQWPAVVLVSRLPGRNAYLGSYVLPAVARRVIAADCCCPQC